MDLSSSQTSTLIRLDDFIDNLEIKTLTEIITLDMEGKFVVLASVESLVEGVDMWYKVDNVGESPRYFINTLSLCYLIPLWWLLYRPCIYFM